MSTRNRLLFATTLLFLLIGGGVWFFVINEQTGTPSEQQEPCDPAVQSCPSEGGVEERDGVDAGDNAKEKPGTKKKKRFKGDDMSKPAPGSGETLVGIPVDDNKHKETGIPDKPPVSSQEDAEAVIAKTIPETGLSNDESLPVISTTKDDKGNEYYQLERKYKGIPIYGSNAILEIEDGKAVRLSGDTEAIDFENFNITPEKTSDVCAAEAYKKLFNDLQNVKDDGNVTLVILLSASKPQLMWHGVFDITLFNEQKQWIEEAFVEAHECEVKIRMSIILE